MSGNQATQHFLLKWNNHRSNLVTVFENLLQGENLVDVTLAVEGKFLKAHKIVLSACSPYFQSMFVHHTPIEKHPIIVFHDLKFSHLKTLLEFMYRGEISIDEKDLSEILKVAEALSIRGLSSFESDDEDTASNPPSQSSQSSNSNVHTNEHTMKTEHLHSSPSSSSNIINGHQSTVGGNSGKNHSRSNENYYGHGPPSLCDSNGCDDDEDEDEQIQVQQRSVIQQQSSQQHRNHKRMNSSNTSKSSGSGSGSKGKKCKLTSTTSSPSKTSFDNTASSNTSGKHTNIPNNSPSTSGIKKKRGRGAGKSTTSTNTSAVELRPPVLKPQESYVVTDVKPVLKTSGVRRRLPKKIGSTIKREKLGTGEGSRYQRDFPHIGEDESSIEENQMELINSEPLTEGRLTEMSVRGLDLFRYAFVEDGVYRCMECEKLHIKKSFKNKYSFQRHAFLYHEGNMRKVFPCTVCSREFSRPDKMKNHLRSIHQGVIGNSSSNTAPCSDLKSSGTVPGPPTPGGISEDGSENSTPIGIASKMKDNCDY